jgi:HD-GYP domain-containing protein (c-di-GMP phosphodiesterase class II)
VREGSHTRSLVGLALALLGPSVLFVVLRLNGDLDPFYRDLNVHIIVVSSIAACALVVALVSTRAAAHADHPGPVWLATGCVMLGLFFFCHGLVTPGVSGRPVNLWVARMPYLAITSFAAALVVASLPRADAVSRLAARRPWGVLGTAMTVTGAFVAALIADPTLVHGSSPVPHENNILWIVAGIDIVLLALAALVHWRRWRLGRDPVQYALLVAASMAAAALLSLRVGQVWHLSWWDYHGFLLAGFAGAVYAVWIRYKRTQAVDRVLASTFDTDPMVHIEAGYPEQLRELVRAVERKDEYTHGHSQRTALVAVQLGLRLGVDEDTLRAIARGGYLHDVGKISVPDDILNKPGALTPDERAVIETHPQLGHDLVAPVPVLRESLSAILHHHERIDGTGYPQGLAGTSIPFIARVVAVADVWDALTSDRSYRPGWAPAEALAHIRAGADTHFDRDVVDAFVSLAADWGYHSGDDGDADEAWRAGQTCHELSTTHTY